MHVFYLILLLRMSIILCWYVLIIHNLLFDVVCCCQTECECDDIINCCLCRKSISSSSSRASLFGKNLTHYYLMKTQQNGRHSKYESHQNGAALMNTSISIDEHLKCKSRSITAVNLIKFYLRMVIVPNAIAIMLQFILFDEYENILNGGDDYEEDIHLYVSVVVLFGSFWSLSDWFYYDRQNVLVSWRDVFNVFMIDLLTNWIKFVYEIFNFFIFLFLCILVVVPLTLFVLLRTVFCPCLFGYGNSGFLLCNLFETVIESMLKVLIKVYI